LAKRNFKRAAHLISRHKETMDHLQASVLDVVEAECVTLCKLQNLFMLWRTSALDMPLHPKVPGQIFGPVHP
jgi:hypothetical protein